MANLIRLDNGQTYSLNKENILGRLSAADIFLDDVSVSRHHAQLNFHNSGQFQLVDMASCNGVAINGSKISKGLVRTGDKITIGKVDLIFSDDAQGASSKPSQSAGNKTIALGSHPQTQNSGSQASNRTATSLEDFISLSPNESIDSAVHHDISRSWLKKIVFTNLAVNAAKNEMEVYEALNDTLQSSIQCSQIYLTVIKDDSENNIALATGDDDSSRMSSDLMRKTLNDGAAFMIRDTSNSKLVDRNTLVNNGVRSVLTAPLLNSIKKSIGFIYIDSKLDQAITNAEFAFARLICMHAGLLLCKLLNTTIVSTDSDKKTLALPGHSDYVHKLMKKIEIFSSLDSPVLIEGHEGNDFAEVADILHGNSNRSNMRLIRINCEDNSGLPIYEQLFGSSSKIQQAKQGSLFIENIDQLDISSQKKLYEFIASGKLNEQDTNTLDTRIICSSKIPFEEAMNQGILHPMFRNVFQNCTLHLCALHEHLDDLPDIVEHYFMEARKQSSNKEIQLEEGAHLALYHCQGNEMEVAFILKFATMKAKTNIITKEQLEKYT
ncbi:sigma 54-interacting transcriptional regulator [Lentisphaera profundi]|uniref:Sigma 54-interacting transcriptional regulator n=1 Tax=Lentisphaera profundi TaxID=1658616 RepID=A0ABY7VTR1_9BACT|nr:sigma 54-interacting transcriptional regulator [Lentisphaera profundi]WDE95518.1 sigma 54-interacting transcriptional regulator [Lentisphaera profundi]